MLKLENSIRGLSFSRVAFDLTIQESRNIYQALHAYLLTGTQKGCNRTQFHRILLQPLI